ncbi:MAG: hypothetical protein ACI4EF_09845 [Coprococcus sp.]
MKHKSRLISLVLILVIIISSLTGCIHKKKTAYQTYIQNLLDVNYKGDFDDYINESGGKESDAVNMYEDCITYLANQLITHYSLDNAKSVTINDTYKKLAVDIYSKTKYEVSEAYKKGSEYYVDVTVYPLNILNQAYDEVFQYIDTFNKNVSEGKYNNYTKEDYEEVFAQGIADILSSKTSNMEYAEPITVSVKMIDDGEYYYIDNNDLARLDAAMLALEEQALPEAASEE